MDHFCVNLSHSHQGHVSGGSKNFQNGVSDQEKDGYFIIKSKGLKEKTQNGIEKTGSTNPVTLFQIYQSCMTSLFIQNTLSNF